MKQDNAHWDPVALAQAWRRCQLKVHTGRTSQVKECALVTRDSGCCCAGPDEGAPVSAPTRSCSSCICHGGSSAAPFWAPTCPADISKLRLCRLCQAPTCQSDNSRLRLALCARRPHTKFHWQAATKQIVPGAHMLKFIGKAALRQTVLVSNCSNGVLMHMPLQRHAADEAVLDAAMPKRSSQQACLSAHMPRELI